MKTRRIVAALVALFMIVAMMPTAVFADGNADGTTPGKVTASKVLVTDKGKPVIDDKGNYTIRISVAGNPVEQTVGANADVVLVIDNSGSMASFVGTLCGYDLSQLNPELDNHKKTYICPECHATYIVVYDEHDETIKWSTLPDNNLCTGNKGSTTNRMEATIELGKTFANSILSQSTNKVAVIGFAHNEYGWYWDKIPVDTVLGTIDFPILKYGIINPAVRVSTGLTNNYQDVESRINAMVANGGTDYTSALQAAYDILNARTDKATRPAYVIFISDGAPGLRGDSLHDADWNGEEQITALKEAGVTIFTAGINLNNNEVSYLKSMASDNKDEHFINVTGNNYSADLGDRLTTWADKIKSSPAGTNAKVTDYINTDSFIVDTTSLTQNGVVYNAETGKLMWDVGIITSEAKTLDIKVKPITNIVPGTYYTNVNVADVNSESCILTYTKPDGSNGELTLVSPSITIDPVVTFVYGESSSTPVTVTYNGSLSSDAIPDPAYKDYTFVGWTTDGTTLLTKEEVVAANTNVTENKTYNAKYTYSVNFEIAGTDQDKGYIEETGNYETTKTLNIKDTFAISGIKATANPGYSFAGWKYNNEKVKDDTVITSSDNGKTFYALFENNPNPNTPQVFKITFTIDGEVKNGTIDGDTADIEKYVNDRGYIVDENVVTDEYISFPEIKAKDGYEFDGWYLIGRKDSIIGTAPAATDSADGKWSDRTYVAKFISNQVETYKVTFDLNGGKVNNSTDSIVFDGYKSGESVATKLPDTFVDPTKESFTFRGWQYLDGDPISTTDAKKLEVTCDMTFVAQYEENTPEPATPVSIDSITLASYDATKEDDGKPLTKDAFKNIEVYLNYSDNTNRKATLKSETPDAESRTVTLVFEEGFKIITQFTGKQVGIGSSDNTFNVESVKELPVPNVFDLTFGKLTITNTDEPDFPLLNSWLKIENNVIAPAGFEKDSYTYEVYNAKNDKLLKTVTVKANSYKSIPLVGSADVYVVPVDAEVTGYTLTTVSDPSDASLSIKVPDTGVVSFTHIYTVGLNTIDHYAYIFGYEDGTVRPEGDITRAEVATIFFRLLSTDAREAFLTRENSFSDVAPDAWYNTAVSTLANVGIITGYPDGTYDPNGSMTRAELVSLIARFFTEIEPGDSQFNDIEGHWAAKEINEAFINGIIDGYDDGSFKPDQSISRAEAMKIINGILGREIGAGSLSDDMKLWPDNADETAWFYYIVQEATNSHEYEIGDHEEWIAIIPDPVWKDLESAPAED